MTYNHLTTRELTLIADFWYQGTKAYRAAKLLQRNQETIYRVYRFLNDGKTIDQYLRHKRRCGRKQTQLPTIEVNYIHAQIKAGWTPDTIIGRHESNIASDYLEGRNTHINDLAVAQQQTNGTPCRP